MELNILFSRKGYTRAPFDDWRKPPTNEREEDGEGGGWRSSGTGPSGRRWNAPATSGSGGPPQGISSLYINQNKEDINVGKLRIFLF